MKPKLLMSSKEKGRNEPRKNKRPAVAEKLLGAMSHDLERYFQQNPSHLSLRRQSLDTTPEYFRGTVAMVHSAFPDGLPLEYYFSLLYLFRQQGWSYRGIAKAVEACFEKEYIEVLNDAYSSDSREPSPDKIQHLRQHLTSHGLETWEKERHDAST